MAGRPAGADGGGLRTATAAPLWPMRKGRGPEGGGLRRDWRPWARRGGGCPCWGSAPIDGSTSRPGGAGAGAASSNPNAGAARPYQPGLKHPIQISNQFSIHF